MTLVICLGFFLGFVAFSVFAGWLSLQKNKVIRLRTEHPWRTLWGIGIGGAPVMTLVTVLEEALVSNSYLSDSVGIAYLIGISLSAVQGLRVTWLRSPVKGGLILLWGFLASFAAGESLINLPISEDVLLLAILLVVPVWVSMALGAEYSARWFQRKDPKR